MVRLARLGMQCCNSYESLHLRRTLRVFAVLSPVGKAGRIPACPGRQPGPPFATSNLK